jgi:hypothetical protein
MAFLIYKISDKRVIKRFDDPFEAENFLKDRNYRKKANFTGFLRGLKSFGERGLAVGSSCDILTAKRQGFEYVIKHGSETYILPEPNKGFFKKILNISMEAINHLIRRSLKSAEERRRL